MRVNTDTVLQARALVGDLTPLKSDCGALCGAACCQADEDGQGGMYLFPGEETLLPGAGGDFAPIYTCAGTCAREERPLACRIFPLAPRRIKGGGFRAQMDARGRPVCPLSRQSRQALDPAFIEAVEAAFTLLAQDEEYARYLTALDALVREYARFVL